jgi:hypothetical protein
MQPLARCGFGTERERERYFQGSLDPPCFFITRSLFLKAWKYRMSLSVMAPEVENGANCSLASLGSCILDLCISLLRDLSFLHNERERERERTLWEVVTVHVSSMPLLLRPGIT